MKLNIFNWCFLCFYLWPGILFGNNQSDLESSIHSLELINHQSLNVSDDFILNGGFIGDFENNTIIAGGKYNNINNEVKYSDSIFMILDDSEHVQTEFVGKLPLPSAYGAGIINENNFFWIGGENSDGTHGKVWQMNWNPDEKKMFLEKEWPDLPSSIVKHKVVISDGWLYVAGTIGTDSIEHARKAFWRINIKEEGEWEELPVWQGNSDRLYSISTQSDGEYNCLYLCTEKSGSINEIVIHKYNPQTRLGRNSWKISCIWESPDTLIANINVGKSIIFFLTQKSSEILNETEPESFKVTNITSFNTITKAIHEFGTINYDARLLTGFIDLDIVKLIGLSSNGKLLNFSTFKLTDFGGHHLVAVDYIIMFTYFLIMLALGFYYSNKNKSSNDYFLGGQKIPFWAAGISLMATQASAIGFMAIPAKSFATNWSYFSGVFTWFIAVPIVLYAFVPFYRKLNVTSVYEYLEKRFNNTVRSFISILYLVFQLIGRMGAIIYLPSIALSAVTGLEVVFCVLVIGILATFYTVLGGMFAVIWTDVLQSFVLFGGIIVCIVYIFLSIEAPPIEVFKKTLSAEKFSLGSMDFDITAAVFWVVIIGNVFNRVSNLSTDQSMVQRYMSTPDEKATRKAIWINVLVSIPWAILVFSLGTALYIFYESHPDLLDPLITYDEIVPFFIVQNLPPGVSGLVIAGIFAAAMSSVDSSIHSSTTVIIQDFMQKDSIHNSGKSGLKNARLITILFGALGTSIAVFMTFLEISSVWDLILEVIGVFSGAMTGIFVLGIFTTRSNSKGALIGVLMSALAVLLVKHFTDIHFFLYSGIGILTCFFFGYISSYFFKSNKNLKGLTIHTI